MHLYFLYSSILFGVLILNDNLYKRWLCFTLFFKPLVSYGLSLARLGETGTRGKQERYSRLTTEINAEYQSLLQIYREFQSYVLIISLNLLQFLSPNNLTLGLAVFDGLYLDFIDRKQGKWSVMSQ